VFAKCLPSLSLLMTGWSSLCIGHRSTTRGAHMDPDHTTSDPTASAPGDAAARGVVAVGLLGVGLVHVLDGIGKYTETRYLFWMFMGLVVSSIAAAAAVLFTRSRVAFLGAAALMASALVGYVLSRTTGLPNATGDIGNWKEPIGVANVFLEVATIAIAAPAYLVHGRSGRIGAVRSAAAGRRRMEVAA
jgi:hypothetical protein